MILETRPITPAEIEVILTALRVAPIAEVTATAIANVSSLQVIGRCGCGCPSIEFEHPAERRESSVIAEAVGETPSGRTVFVDVWGREDAITGLEISDPLTSTGELPTAESIRSDA